MEVQQVPSFTFVLNKQSGPHDGDEIQALIEATIPPERLQALMILDESEDLVELVRKALQHARASGGCVVLAGGDGTINAALPTLLEENDVPFSVLPLGTFNFFARSQGIDLEPERALLALLEAAPVDVPVATLNGYPFVINISLGVFPRIIDAREQHQARFGRNRYVALASGCYTALNSLRDHRMTLTVDGHRRRLRSPMVSAVFNRYQVEVLNLDTACIDRQKMTVLITRPVSRWGMLGLLLRGATGHLDNAENLETLCATELTISMRRPSVRVAIDGETRRFSTPLRLKVHPRGLHLMAPVRADSGHDESIDIMPSLRSHSLR